MVIMVIIAAKKNEGWECMARSAFHFISFFLKKKERGYLLLVDAFETTFRDGTIIADNGLLASPMHVSTMARRGSL